MNLYYCCSGDWDLYQGTSSSRRGGCRSGGICCRFCINLTSLHLIYLVDVVLDPNTAHPNIVLSADGKQAGRGELLHIVPDNPQRFDPVICVVGKKGFLSGRFYFQVSVFKVFWKLTLHIM